MTACKDCTERTEYGLCHMKCPKYLAEREERQKRYDERLAAIRGDGYEVQRMKASRKGWAKKNWRSGVK